MNIKTSSLIALKFTVYITVLLFVVGLFINGLFFGQRYRGEVAKLLISKRAVGVVTSGPRGSKIPMIKPLFDEVRTLLVSSEIRDILLQGHLFDRLIKVDDQYIVVNKDWLGVNEGNQIRFVEVTHFMEAQKRLLRITISIIVSCSLLTYALSRRFVRSSLGRVHALNDFVKGLDLHTLHQRVPVLGPQNDEIQIIADKLQDSLDVIKQQADALKGFVTSASHELKTPLMSMSALIDLANKTGSFDVIGDKLKKQITYTNKVFEMLIALAKQQFEKSDTIEIDLVSVIEGVVDTVSHLFPRHKKDIICSLPKHYPIYTDETAIKIIITNLLTNACKFTPVGKKIEITLEHAILSIKDEGRGITQEEIDHIWEKFWTRDISGGGSGIGLYVVKTLITKIGWDIQVRSSGTSGTAFTIYIPT